MYPYLEHKTEWEKSVFSEEVATLRDGSPLVQQVSDQFGGCDRGEDAIYEGQVSEKEVHGSWKCGAEGDGYDNEQVGQHSK